MKGPTRGDPDRSSCGNLKGVQAARHMEARKSDLAKYGLNVFPFAPATLNEAGAVYVGGSVSKSLDGSCKKSLRMYRKQAALRACASQCKRQSINDCARQLWVGT